jgi:hypothetical protein
MHTQRSRALRDALGDIEAAAPETSFLRLKQWKSRRNNVLRLQTMFAGLFHCFRPPNNEKSRGTLKKAVGH